MTHEMIQINGAKIRQAIHDDDPAEAVLMTICWVVVSSLLRIFWCDIAQEILLHSACPNSAWYASINRHDDDTYSLMLQCGVESTLRR
jgi:hypothetical protein